VLRGRSGYIHGTRSTTITYAWVGVEPAFWSQIIDLWQTKRRRVNISWRFIVCREIRAGRKSKYSVTWKTLCDCNLDMRRADCRVNIDAGWLRPDRRTATDTKRSWLYFQLQSVCAQPHACRVANNRSSVSPGRLGDETTGGPRHKPDTRQVQWQRYAQRPKHSILHFKTFYGFADADHNTQVVWTYLLSFLQLNSIFRQFNSLLRLSAIYMSLERSSHDCHRIFVM